MLGGNIGVRDNSNAYNIWVVPCWDMDVRSSTPEGAHFHEIQTLVQTAINNVIRISIERASFSTPISKSLAGAIVFTILYVFLLTWLLRQPFIHPTYVHYILIRVSPPILQNIFIVGLNILSTSRRVCHTLRFSSLKKVRRVAWIGHCRWSSFRCRLLFTPLFGVHPGSRPVSLIHSYPTWFCL